MLNRVLTRVDFPRPDSPETRYQLCSHEPLSLVHTDNHDIEVETLADTLAVPLVGQIGETNIASELAADDVLHIGSSLGHGLGVAGADRLGGSGAHGVAALHVRRLFTTRSGSSRFVAGRDGGTVRRRRS